METKDRQSILDIAIQTSGSIEAIFDLALINGLSITADIRSGELIQTSVINKIVYDKYSVSNIQPATNINDVKSNGIGFFKIGSFVIKK